MSGIKYLTGVSNHYTMEEATGSLYGSLGVLLGPATFGGPGTKADYTPHLQCYPAGWALDNGCFTNHGAFDEDKWLTRLATIMQTVPDAHDHCLFAVAPDVFDPVAMKGDPVATIERSLPVLPKIREAGAPAALVLQDGIEHMDLDALPWSEFDVAFIGGSDGFKLGSPDHLAKGRVPAYDRESEDSLAFIKLMARCHNEGVDIHLGRCNSKVRLAYGVEIGAASADGTMIAHGGKKVLAQLERWLPEVNWWVGTDHDPEAVAVKAFLQSIEDNKQQEAA